MSRLKEDFPGYAELDAAGEATTAKVRDRIKKDTLTEIPGIGPATASKIKEAFEALDTPADQAEDLRAVENDDSITPASQAKELAARESKTEDPELAGAGAKADDVEHDSKPAQEKAPLLERVASAIETEDGKALTAL